MSHQRHNFTKPTIESLAKRVAFRCSNPNCNIITVGPSKENQLNSTTIGVASHIHAASVGGPRYLSKMSESERSSIQNGIWLCVNCSTIIDKEPSTFPAQLLRKWKTETEKHIRNQFDKALKQISKLQELKSSRFSTDNLLVRKNFTVAEVCEMINMLGLSYEIIQIANLKDFTYFTDKLYCVKDIPYPKILVLSLDQRKRHVSFGLITGINFKKAKRTYLKDGSKNQIEMRHIENIDIEHADISYRLRTSQKTKLGFETITRLKRPFDNKLITPLFFIFSKPRNLKVTYEDVRIELLAITFFFEIFFEDNFVAPIFWKIDLEPYHEISSDIKIDSENSHYWILTAKINDISLVKSYFYYDSHGNIRTKTTSDSEEFYNILKEATKANYSGAVKQGLKSLVLESIL